MKRTIPEYMLSVEFLEKYFYFTKKCNAAEIYHLLIEKSTD